MAAKTFVLNRRLIVAHAYPDARVSCVWRSLPSVFQLVEAFVKARVGMVEACIRGDVEEDDLESPDRIEEQLEQLPGLFRYRS
jgi:hypothetical protein